MASANNQSDHNDISQPTAPSSEDQQDQSPIRRVGDKEKTEQPVAMEQEECYAIGRPGDTSIMVTDQILADLEISLQQPLPEIDGSVDLEPYHADAATVYDWAKPEAWIQEKDSEGN